MLDWADSSAKAVPPSSREDGHPQDGYPALRSDRRLGDGGAVGGSALAAGLPAAGEVVVLDPDAEIGDLVAQGVAVDPKRPGRAAEVAPVGFEGGHDELPLELSSGLLQRHASAYELIDDLVQASIEVLIGQWRSLREEIEADSLPQAQGEPNARGGYGFYFGSSRSPR